MEWLANFSSLKIFILFTLPQNLATNHEIKSKNPHPIHRKTFQFLYDWARNKTSFIGPGPKVDQVMLFKSIRTVPRIQIQ